MLGTRKAIEEIMSKADKIEVGTNYKMFRFIKGNRPIVENKVKKLLKAYKDGLDLFRFCPVLINNDNLVIDGQHRIEACKRLKLPVYYMVVPEISVLQIAQMNNVSDKWNSANFMNCFIEQGNKDYTKLKAFMETYSLATSSAAGLLMFGSCAGGGALDHFRAGTFKVKEEEKATKIVKAAFDYLHLAEDGVVQSSNFLRAIGQLLACHLYKHKEVVGKLKDRKSMIQLKANYKEYIFHIEELFNRGNSKRYIIYEKADKSAKEDK